jgi:hypothetical protein
MFPSLLHTCGEARHNFCIHWGKHPKRRGFPRDAQSSTVVEKPVVELLSILAPSPSSRGFRPLSPSREAHLSAQRATAEAPARFPSSDVNSGRPRDPQAAQGPRAQAPLGVDSRPTCSAATACLARVTSMPSTGTAAPSRRASSSSTGLIVKETTTVKRASASRCRSASAAR